MYSDVPWCTVVHCYGESKIRWFLHWPTVVSVWRGCHEICGIETAFFCFSWRLGVKAAGRRTHGETFACCVIPDVTHRVISWIIQYAYKDIASLRTYEARMYAYLDRLVHTIGMGFLSHFYIKKKIVSAIFEKGNKYNKNVIRKKKKNDRWFEMIANLHVI